MNIRTEEPKDFQKIDEVIRSAFAKAEHTDGNEHNLVKALRKGEAYIPDLALVAEEGGEIVGHILFTKLKIVDDAGVEHASLALAPVSVAPAHQGKGVGAKLIEEGHRRAQNLGYSSVILLGHAGYYPRFGYQPTTKWKIRAPFEVPAEAFMALEFVPNSLRPGVVKYPPEFGIN